LFFFIKDESQSTQLNYTHTHTHTQTEKSEIHKKPPPIIRPLERLPFRVHNACDCVRSTIRNGDGCGVQKEYTETQYTEKRGKKTRIRIYAYVQYSGDKTRRRPLNCMRRVCIVRLNGSPGRSFRVLFVGRPRTDDGPGNRKRTERERVRESIGIISRTRRSRSRHAQWSRAAHTQAFTARRPGFLRSEKVVVYTCMYVRIL